MSKPDAPSDEIRFPLFLSNITLTVQVFHMVVSCLSIDLSNGLTRRLLITKRPSPCQLATLTDQRRTATMPSGSVAQDYGRDY